MVAGEIFVKYGIVEVFLEKKREERACEKLEHCRRIADQTFKILLYMIKKSPHEGGREGAKSWRNSVGSSIKITKDVAGEKKKWELEF